MPSPVNQQLGKANLETYGIAHLLDSNEAPDPAQAYIVKVLVEQLLRVLQMPQPSSIPTSPRSSLLSPGRSIFLPTYPNLRHRADVSLHLRKKVRAYKSILHPIRRIPIFLWSYIFQMMTDEGDADQIDMVGYSHVCSKWRTSIIGTPEIWREIHVMVDKDVEELWDVDVSEEEELDEDYERGTLVEVRAGETLREFTSTIMRRSANLPIDINLHYEKEEEMALARPVFDSFEERDRWKSLTTGVVGFSEIFGDAGQTWDTLQKVVVTQKGGALLHNDVFGQVSMLTAYKLQSLTMEWNGTLPTFARTFLPWSQLRELHLDITYCTVAEHVSIISNCPSLHVLSIALTTSQVYLPCDPHFLDGLRGNRLIHPRIQTFTFTARNMAHSRLLDYFSFPSLVDLMVKFEYAPKGWFFMPRGSRDKRGGRFHEVVAFLEACGSERCLKGFEFWSKFNMPWKDLAVLFGAMPAVEEMSLRIGNDGNYVSNSGCDMVEDMIGELRNEIKEEDEEEAQERAGKMGSMAASSFTSSDDERSHMSPTPTPSASDSGFEDTTVVAKHKFPRHPRLVRQETPVIRQPPLPALSKLHIHGKFIQLPIILLLKLVGYDVISIEEPVHAEWYEDVVTLDFDVVTKKLVVVSANALTKEMVKECLDIAEQQAFAGRL